MKVVSPGLNSSSQIHTSPGKLLQLIISSWFLVALLVAGCGYRFTGGAADNPFPENLKTIEVRSAINNTRIAGIETELTNDLRDEFALDTRLKPVRSEGDTRLETVIASYEETASTYTAYGKELTRTGTLHVACELKQVNPEKTLWKRSVSASSTYNVTDSITETLTNRRRAISHMIKDIVPKIYRCLYEDF